MEAEHVLGCEHAENQGDCGGDRAPQEKTDALCFQTVDETGTSGDADNGDKDIQAYRIHEPDSRRWNASKLRAYRTQPSTDDTGNQRSAGSRQSKRHASHVEDQRAD